MHLLKPRTTVIPAQAGGVVQGCTVYGPEDGIQMCLTVEVFLDDSLRSPFGPTFSRSTRFALLSGLRRNDENPAIRVHSRLNT
jgi:hypothetical protein